MVIAKDNSIGINMPYSRMECPSLTFNHLIAKVALKSEIFFPLVQIEHKSQPGRNMADLAGCVLLRMKQEAGEHPPGLLQEAPVMVLQKGRKEVRTSPEAGKGSILEAAPGLDSRENLCLSVFDPLPHSSWAALE